MNKKKVGRWSFVIRRLDNRHAVRTRSGHLCWEAEGSSRQEAETKVLERAREQAETGVYISGYEPDNLTAIEIEEEIRS